MTKNGKARKRSNLVIGMVQLLVLAVPVTAQIPCGGYEVTAIIHAPDCPPFGIPPTIGTGISEPIDGGLPNVVGYYQSCAIGPDTAFLWIGNGNKFITIPMPDGTSYSRALDISGSLIVGEYDNQLLELGRTGFLYDFETDEFTSLGTLPGGNWSKAHGINAVGQITGFWGNNVIGPWQAFMWEDGVMNDLGPLIGGAANRALDINEKGAITGWWQREDGGERIAFVWEDGAVTSLGPIPEGFSSTGQAINILGYVAGDGKIVLDDGKTIVVQSFLWAYNQMTNLGTLPGTTFARARGINDQTRIAGYCHNAGLVDLAPFIWQNGVMTNINDLLPPDSGLTVYLAEGINNAGQIAGSATNEFGDLVAVLLTPIEGPPGDINADCQVGASDLLILLSSWGPCDDCGTCPADLDGNCVVGASDLLILLVNWG